MGERLAAKCFLVRRLLAVRDSAAARASAMRWIAWHSREGAVAWFGAEIPEGLPGARPAQAAHWLGRELDAVVFECGTVPESDALAVAAGLIRGGGVLVLLVAAVAPGPFGQRWSRFLAEDTVRWVDPGEPWPPVQPAADAGKPFLSRAQQGVFDRIIGLPHEEPGRPVLLTAPRGRGKSTVLGALVRSWLDDGPATVRVTARNPAAIEILMRQLEGGPQRQRRSLHARECLYEAPDQILAAQPPDVLVVDEAAALPVRILLALAAHAPRAVFATTTSGFEGSGKGFLLRFVAGLHGKGLAPRRHRLHRPLRWSPGDPLEDWVNRLFLLEAEADTITPAKGPRDPKSLTSRVQWVTGAWLGCREQDLSAVVGLLSDAHYRTRPSDLQRWLDDPGLRMGLLRGPGHSLVGVVVVLAERGLETAEARAVWSGERRPPGHFLPCILAVHGAFREAAQPALRVTRIAVHPRWQRHGLGRRLLRAAERRAVREGFPRIGASFGANRELLEFWQASGFRISRIGFRRETTSGLHATVVLKGLGRAARADLERLLQEVAADWPVWRQGALSGLEPDTAAAMHRSLPDPVAPPPEQDRESVWAFAFAQRSFELTLPALYRWLRNGGGMDHPLPQGDRELLESAALEGADWRRLCALTGESGRNGVIRVLRRSVARALRDNG